MTQHKCSKCGEADITKFGPQKGSKDGLSIWCKLCWKKYRDGLSKEEIQAINNRHYIARNKRRGEARLKIFEYLKTHPCITCGESDPVVLCFDHLDPSTKIATISIMVSRHAYKWEIIEEEIKKCQVLCANCHARKTAKEQNWYGQLDSSWSLNQDERMRRGHYTKPPKKNKSSKYKGVTFNKQQNIWIAIITVNYNKMHLGSFDTEHEAALIYNKAALKYFGPHAYTNPMPTHKNTTLPKE